MSRVFLNGCLEWPFHETVGLKPGLPWRPQDVGDARAVSHLLTEAATKEWNQPKRWKCVSDTKAERSGNLKSILTSHMEMESLEFAQLVCSLALVQYFLTMLPSLHFGMVMYILCHYMLEVCDLLFDLDFHRGITGKKLSCIT